MNMYKIINGFILGPYVNLSGQDLSNSTITDTDLSGANLINCIFKLVQSSNIQQDDNQLLLSSDYKIINKILIGPYVFLKNNDLSDMDLRFMNLTGVRTHNIIVNNNTQFPSTHYKVISGYLFGPNVDISYADLSNANLSALTYNNLNGISSSHLSYNENTILPTGYKIINGLLIGKGVKLGDISYMTLKDIDLSDVDLRQSNMEELKTSGIISIGEMPNNYVWCNGTIVGPQVYLDNANLIGNTSNNTPLSSVNLLNIKSKNIDPAKFSVVGYTVINGHIFGPKLDLKCANLSNSTINGFDIRGSNLLGADLTNCKWTNITSDATTILTDGYSIINGVLIGDNTDVSGLTITQNMGYAIIKCKNIKAQTLSLSDSNIKIDEDINTIIHNPSITYDTIPKSVSPVTDYVNVQRYTQATILTNYTQSLSIPTAGNNNNGYWTISLGFNVYYDGVSYNTIYVGTNSFISFAAPETGATIPSANIIKLGAYDCYCPQIFYNSSGSSPNRIYSIKYTGNSSNANSAVDTIWEVKLYENSEQITINLDNSYDIYNIIGKTTSVQWGIYGNTVGNSLINPSSGIGYKFITWKVQINPSPTVGSTDSGYWKISLGFNIIYNSKTYDSLYVSSNSYISFEGGDTVSSYTKYPKIMLATSDYKNARIDTKILGIAPARKIIIRYQSSDPLYDISTMSRIWECVFYEGVEKVDITMGSYDYNGALQKGISGFFTDTNLIAGFLLSKISSLSYNGISSNKKTGYKFLKNSSSTYSIIGPNMDLSNIDLSYTLSNVVSGSTIFDNLDLSGATLSNVNFTGFSLTYSNLKTSKLFDCSFGSLTLPSVNTITKLSSDYFEDPFIANEDNTILIDGIKNGDIELGNGYTGSSIHCLNYKGFLPLSQIIFYISSQYDKPKHIKVYGSNKDITPTYSNYFSQNLSIDMELQKIYFSTDATSGINSSGISYTTENSITKGVVNITPANGDIYKYIRITVTETVNGSATYRMNELELYNIETSSYFPLSSKYLFSNSEVLGPNLVYNRTSQFSEISGKTLDLSNSTFKNSSINGLNLTNCTLYGLKTVGITISSIILPSPYRIININDYQSIVGPKVILSDIEINNTFIFSECDFTEIQSKNIKLNENHSIETVMNDLTTGNYTARASSTLNGYPAYKTFNRITSKLAPSSNLPNDNYGWHQNIDHYSYDEEGNAFIDDYEPNSALSIKTQTIGNETIYGEWVDISNSTTNINSNKVKIYVMNSLTARHPREITICGSNTGENNSWVKIYNSGQSNISYTETSTEMYATFLYNVSSYKYMRLIVNRIGQTYYRDYLMLIEIDYFYEISPNITAKINNSHEQFSIINGYIIGPTVKVNDINFSSFNFSSFNLSGVHLSNVKFINCNFSSTNFSNSTLNNVSFINCDFTSTNFLSSIMDRVKFGKLKISDTLIFSSSYSIISNSYNSGKYVFGPGSDLTSEDISTIDLSVLNRIQMINMTLNEVYNINLPTGYRLIYGNVVGPNMNLSFTDFTDNDLTNADFSGTNISGSVFYNATLQNITSENIKATVNPIFKFSNYVDINVMPKYKVSNGYIIGYKVNLSNKSLFGVDLTDAMLLGVNMTNTNFNGCINSGGILPKTAEPYQLKVITETILPENYRIVQGFLVGPNITIKNLNIVFDYTKIDYNLTGSTIISDNNTPLFNMNSIGSFEGLQLKNTIFKFSNYGIYDYIDSIEEKETIRAFGLQCTDNTIDGSGYYGQNKKFRAFYKNEYKTITCVNSGLTVEGYNTIDIMNTYVDLDNYRFINYPWNGTICSVPSYRLVRNMYSTTSETQLVLNISQKTLLVNKYLSWKSNMQIQISYDKTNYFIGTIISYIAPTGSLIVNPTTIVGTGTFSFWYVNLVNYDLNPLSDQQFILKTLIAGPGIKMIDTDLRGIDLRLFPSLVNVQSENLIPYNYLPDSETTINPNSPLLPPTLGIQNGRFKYGYENPTTRSITQLSLDMTRKTLTVKTGLSWVNGMQTQISYSKTKYFTGNVVSYTSRTGLLVVDPTIVEGTGTFSYWYVNIADTNTQSSFYGYAAPTAPNNQYDNDSKSYYDLFQDGKTFFETIYETNKFSILELKTKFGNYDWEKFIYETMNEIKKTNLKYQKMYKIAKQFIKQENYSMDQSNVKIPTVFLPILCYSRDAQVIYCDETIFDTSSVLAKYSNYIELNEPTVSYKIYTFGTNQIKIRLLTDTSYTVEKNTETAVIKNIDETYEYENCNFYFCMNGVVFEKLPVLTELNSNYSFNSHTNSVLIDSNNNYNFNGYNGYFTITDGMYTFENVPEYDAVGFIVEKTSYFRIISSTTKGFPIITNQDESYSKTVLSEAIQHHYGTIKIEITGNCGTIRLHNYNKGYGDGEYKKIAYVQCNFINKIFDCNSNLTIDLSSTTFLRNKNLSGAVFSNKVVFGNADLTNANLSNINLSSITVMTDVIFNNNITGNIIFSQNNGSILPNLPSGYIFNTKGYIVGPKMNLSNIDFSNYNFANSNLEGTNLSGSILSGVKSGNIKFNQTTILPSQYSFVGQNSNGYIIGPSVNLENADLTDCDLSNCILTNVKSYKVIKSNCIFSVSYDVIDGYIIGPNLNLENAIFTTSFSKNLSGSNLTNATIKNCDITGSNFTGCNFTGLKTSNLLPFDNNFNVIFSEGYEIRSGYILGPYIQLSGIDLSNSDLSTIDFSYSKIASLTISSQTIFKKNINNEEIYKVISGYLVGPYIDISDLNLSSDSFYGLCSGNILSNDDTRLPDNYKIKNGYIIGAGVNLFGASFNNLNLQDCSLLDVKSGNITISNTQLPDNYFVLDGYILGPSVDLSNRIFQNTSIFTGKDLSNSNFTSSTLINLNISQTIFTSCIFNDVISSGLNYTEIPTFSSDYIISNGILFGPYVDLTNKSINFSLENMNLQGANLTNAIFNGVNVDNLNLSDAVFTNFSSSGLIVGTPGPMFSINKSSDDYNNTYKYKVINGHIIGPDINLYGVDLSSCNLSDVPLNNIKSGNIIHNNTILPSGYKFIKNGYIIGTSIDASGFDLTNEDLTNVSLKGCKTKNIKYGIQNLTLPTGYIITRDGYILGPNTYNNNINLLNTDLREMDYTNISLTEIIYNSSTLLKDNYFIYEKCLLGVNVNLSGINKSFNDDLINKNLSSINLSESIIYDTDLTGTNLTNANLSGIISYGIRCRQSLLPTNYHIVEGTIIGPNTNLNRKIFVNIDSLKNKNLSGANLSDVNLSNMDLTGTNFTNANLTNVILTNTNLSGTNFTGSNLTNVVSGRIKYDNENTPILNIIYQLSNGYIIGKNVNLVNAIFNNITITVDLEGVISSKIIGIETITNSNYKFINGYIVGPNINLNGYNFENTNLTSCVFIGCKTNGIIYNSNTQVPIGYQLIGEYNYGCIIGENVDISYALFRNTDIINSNLSGIISRNLSGSPTFNNSDYFIYNNVLLGPNIIINNVNINGNFSYKNLSGSTLTDVSITGDISGTNFSNAIFKNVKFDVSFNDEPVLPLNYEIIEGKLIGENVNLSNSIFTNVNSLAGKNLMGSDLSFIDFTGFNLEGTNIKNTTLSNIKSGNIVSNDFTLLNNGYDIIEGVIVGPYLDISDNVFSDETKDFSSLILTGIKSKNLSNVILPDGYVLIDGKIIGPSITVTNLNLYGKDLTNCDLTNVISGNITFSDTNNSLIPRLPPNYKIIGKQGLGFIIGQGSDITGVNLYYENLYGINGVNLKIDENTIFPVGTGFVSNVFVGPGAIIRDISLNDVNLSIYDLTGVVMENIKNDKVKLKKGYGFINDFLVGPDLVIINKKFESVRLIGYDLTNTDLSTCTFKGIKSENLTSKNTILPINYNIIQGYLFGPDVILENIYLEKDTDLSKVNFYGSQVNFNYISGTSYSFALPVNYTIVGTYIIGPNMILNNVDLSQYDLSSLTEDNLYHLTTFNIITNNSTLPTYTRDGIIKYYKNINGILFGPNLIVEKVDMVSYGFDFSDLDLTGVIFKKCIGGIVLCNGTTILPIGYKITSKNYFIGAEFTLLDLDLSNENLENVNLTNSVIFGVKSGGIIKNSSTILPENYTFTDNGYILGRGVNLSGASLSNTNLSTTDFYKVDLTNADLSGANLNSNMSIKDAIIKNTKIDRYTILPENKKFFETDQTYGFVIKEFENIETLNSLISYINNLENNIEYMNNIRKIYIRDMIEPTNTYNSNPIFPSSDKPIKVFKNTTSIHLDSDQHNFYTNPDILTETSFVVKYDSVGGEKVSLITKRISLTQYELYKSIDQVKTFITTKVKGDEYSFYGFKFTFGSVYVSQEINSINLSGPLQVYDKSIFSYKITSSILIEAIPLTVSFKIIGNTVIEKTVSIDVNETETYLYLKIDEIIPENSKLTLSILGVSETIYSEFSSDLVLSIVEPPLNSNVIILEKHRTDIQDNSNTYKLILNNSFQNDITVRLSDENNKVLLANSTETNLFSSESSDLTILYATGIPYCIPEYTLSLLDLVAQHLENISFIKTNLNNSIISINSPKTLFASNIDFWNYNVIIDGSSILNANFYQGLNDLIKITYPVDLVPANLTGYEILASSIFLNWNEIGPQKAFNKSYDKNDSLSCWYPETGSYDGIGNSLTNIERNKTIVGSQLYYGEWIQIGNSNSLIEAEKVVLYCTTYSFRNPKHIIIVGKNSNGNWEKVYSSKEDQNVSANGISYTETTTQVFSQDLIFPLKSVYNYLRLIVNELPLGGDCPNIVEIMYSTKIIYDYSVREKIKNKIINQYFENKSIPFDTVSKEFVGLSADFSYPTVKLIKNSHTLDVSELGDMFSGVFYKSLSDFTDIILTDTKHNLTYNITPQTNNYTIVVNDIAQTLNYNSVQTFNSRYKMYITPYYMTFYEYVAIANLSLTDEKSQTTITYSVSIKSDEGQYTNATEAFMVYLSISNYSDTILPIFIAKDSYSGSVSIQHTDTVSVQLQSVSSNGGFEQIVLETTVITNEFIEEFEISNILTKSFMYSLEVGNTNIGRVLLLSKVSGDFNKNTPNILTYSLYSPINNVYSNKILGLEPNTTYYVRNYKYNYSDFIDVYSSITEFKTLETLSGVNLVLYNLTNEDLSGELLPFNFSNKDLSNVNLYGADLSGCNLSNALLTNIRINNDTKIGPLSIESASVFDINYKIVNEVISGNKYLVGKNTNLSGINLEGMDLTGCINLSGIKLSNTTRIGPFKMLANAIVSRGYKIITENNDANKKYLIGPNANLQGLQAFTVENTYLDLSGVDLTGTVLTGVYIKNNTLGPLNYWNKSLSFEGSIKYGQFGSGIVCNIDGTIIAYAERQSNKGKVHIYKNINDSWIKYGNSIYQTSSTYSFGEVLALSNDGNTLVISDYDWNVSSIYVYKYTTSWNLIQTITPTSQFNGSFFGRSVSLSGNADCLVVGAPQYNNSQGKVLLFEFDINSGQFIETLNFNGSNITNRIGNSVVISRDGNTIAISGNYMDNTNIVGCCVIYKKEGTNWNLITTLVELISNSSPTLSISSDGSKIAAGYTQYSDYKGCVFIYDKNVSGWNKVASLYGVDNYTMFGVNLYLSGNGNKLVVSSNRNNNGEVKTYSIQNNVWIEKTVFMSTEQYESYGRACYGSENGDTILFGSSGNYGKIEVFKVSSNAPVNYPSVSGWSILKNSNDEMYLTVLDTPISEINGEIITKDTVFQDGKTFLESTYATNVIISEFIDNTKNNVNEIPVILNDDQESAKETKLLNTQKIRKLILTAKFKDDLLAPYVVVPCENLGFTQSQVKTQTIKAINPNYNQPINLTTSEILNSIIYCSTSEIIKTFIINLIYTVEFVLALQNRINVKIKKSGADDIYNKDLIIGKSVLIEGLIITVGSGMISIVSTVITVLDDSVTVNTEVVNTDNNVIVESGICWTNTFGIEPVKIDNHKTTDSPVNNGPYSISVDNLNIGSYNLRSYYTDNTNNTYYGTLQSFTISTISTHNITLTLSSNLSSVTVGGTIIYTINVSGQKARMPYTVMLSSGNSLAFSPEDISKQFSSAGSIVVSMTNVSTTNIKDVFNYVSNVTVYVNSDNSGSAGGDPYITTLETQEFYKLPGKIRNYRLFQSQNCVINASVSPIKSRDAENLIRAFKDVEGFKPKTDGFYFDAYHIQIGEEFITFDERIELIDYKINTTSNFHVKRYSDTCTKNINGMSSTYFLTEILVLDSSCGNLLIELKRDVNPQIVNGISISIGNRECIKNTKGALVRRSNPRNYEIKSLNNLKLINENKYSTSKNYHVKQETFYSKEVIGLSIN